MTVLGGYLGAGKTTLVNELLAGAAGLRVAVVVNDFGAVNVDADLVRSRSEDTLELANGCVCCSLADGMAAVMERLRAMTPPPDHVLVEVSGVGNPAAVAAWGDHPGFRRNGVLVCADVESVRDQADDRWVGDTVRGQLRGADTVLLTKTDRVTAELAARVRDWVAAIAPGASILVDRARVPALLLTGSGLSTAAGRTGGDDVVERSASRAPHDGVHTSWSLEWAAAVDRQELLTLMRTLSPHVARAKGVVRTLGRPDARTLVHVAGGRVELVDDGPWQSSSARSRLVVIIAGPQAEGEPALVTALRRALGVDSG